jgi:hypothetical protein
VATARNVTPAQATQRFEQHVSRACAEPVAAGCRVQARLDQRPAGLDLAGQAFLAEPAMRAQSHECCLGRGAMQKNTLLTVNEKPRHEVGASLRWIISCAAPLASAVAKALAAAAPVERLNKI